MDSHSLEHSFSMCICMRVFVCSCLQESFVLVMKPVTRVRVEDPGPNDYRVQVNVPPPDIAGQCRRSASSLNCVLGERVVGILIY
jgi:hypothetical protein